MTPKRIVPRALTIRDIDEAAAYYLGDGGERVALGFVDRHPHLVFYVERDNHVDVFRVLHGERDIPSWMGQAGAL